MSIQPPADQELTERIRQRLLDDTRLAEGPIEVASLDGIVTLKGAVRSFRRKLLAEKIASSARGCRGVLNDLSVQPDGPVPDEHITTFVRDSLAAHADIPEGTTSVNASLGTVTLSGTVPSHWVRRIAEDVALSCRGVRKVNNLLMVDRGASIADLALAESVQIALAAAAGLKGTDVRTTVSGDTVVLTGEVDELWQSERAEDIAGAQGLRSVRNEIVVR